MLGISIKNTIGIGDQVQFCSLPENYFRCKGERLIDVSRPWFFDHNPFVIRTPADNPSKVIELWNFGPKQYEWPRIRGENVYISNAEIWASLLQVPVTLNRPRLYQFEEFPFEKRETILIQTEGRSHGQMPMHVITHVLRKYGKTKRLIQIGTKSALNIGLPRAQTESMWDLAKVISEARMLICMDSGPSWIAAAYPDVVVKKIRTRPPHGELGRWVPLQVDNIHSHWDDRCHQIFNTSEHDIGFTQSYLKI